MVHRYIITVKSAGNIAKSSCELSNNGVKVSLVPRNCLLYRIKFLNTDSSLLSYVLLPKLHPTVCECWFDFRGDKFIRSRARKNLEAPSLVSVRLDVIAVLVSRQPIGLICEE